METNGKHWKRCFNARDHSYSAYSFHALCNNKGPTVTLVETGRYVFGGYTDQPWTSGKCHDNTRSVVATRAIAKVFLVTDDFMTRYGLRSQVKFVPQLRATNDDSYLVSSFPALCPNIFFGFAFWLVSEKRS